MNSLAAVEERQNTVAALARGDRTAFRQLYLETKPALDRLAWAVVLDPAEASDVVQEVYLRLHREAHRLPADVRLEAWLARVTINEACSWRRRVLRFGRGWRRPRIAATLKGRSAKAKRWPCSVKACAPCPRPSVQSRPCTWIAGLSPTQIAEAPEITANSVRVTLHRALKRLRTTLERAGIDPQSLAAPPSPGPLNEADE